MLRQFCLGVLLSCLVQVGALCGPSGAVDEFEPFHKNRSVAAKEYHDHEGQLSGAHIVLRTLREQRGWLSILFGTDRLKRVEVQAVLKSGEALIIDRLPEDARALPIIIDGSGSLVGYFLYTVTEADSFRAHRAQFVVYLVRNGRLVRREGEVKCQKIKSAGAPRAEVSNASWDEALRELSFTVRSSCNHITLFGRGASRTMNMLTGRFDFDEKAKDAAWTDWGQKLRATFDADGENFEFDIDKGDGDKRRAFAKCVNDAEEVPGLRVCGNGNRRLAYWQFEGRRVAVSLCERATTEAQGRTYVAEGCIGDSAEAMRARVGLPASSVDEKTEKRWVDLIVATEVAPRALETSIKCSCGRLEADRISFDPDARSVSFNLDTDAKRISIEGIELQVPVAEPRTQEGTVTARVPVVTLKFNERWQAIELTAVGGASDQRGK